MRHSKKWLWGLFGTLLFFAWPGGVSAQLSFGPATNYLTGLNGEPYVVFPGDFNGDGRIDIFVGCTGFSCLITNPAFDRRASYVQASAGGMTAIDVNGDGRLDLVSTLTVGLRLSTNNGRGDFGTWLESLGAKREQVWVISADVNGDGYPDLIGADYTNSITIWTNNGHLGFGSNTMITVGYYPTFITAADLNGDGSIDLITANLYGNTWGNTNIGTLTILTNNGSGVFGSNAILFTEGGAAWVAVADINGDGKPDLVCANYFASSLTMYTNDGTGGFVLSTNLPVPPGNPFAVIAADLDGNGTMDLVVSCDTTPGALVVLTNDGAGIFSIGTQIPISPRPEPLAAVDLNGDGKLDLIYSIPPYAINANNDEVYLGIVMNTSIFPPPVNTPGLSIKPALRGSVVSWPSVSPGWSLQQSRSLLPGSWGPSGYAGYPINDDGTNKSLYVPVTSGNLYFRLMHP